MLDAQFCWLRIECPTTDKSICNYSEALDAKVEGAAVDGGGNAAEFFLRDGRCSMVESAILSMPSIFDFFLSFFPSLSLPYDACDCVTNLYLSVFLRCPQRLVMIMPWSPVFISFSIRCLQALVMLPVDGTRARNRTQSRSGARAWAQTRAQTRARARFVACMH
jgi:hypothetical protein